MARLTIEYSEKVDKILENLAKKDQISKVEVLRRALALYSYAHDESESESESESGKHKISITDEHDKIIHNIIFD